MDSFASNLCVGNANITRNTAVNMTEATSAALFDVNNSNIIYGMNMHERLAPASLTKVLPALVANTDVDRFHCNMLYAPSY